MLTVLLLWIAVLSLLAMCAMAPLPNMVKALFLFAFVITIWFMWGLFGAKFIAEQLVGSNKEAINIGTLGQAGDLFGGINALFAALAFAGVAIAGYWQAISAQLSIKQSVESTFFSALNLHHQIADSLRFNPASFPVSNELLRLQSISGITPKYAAPVEGREVFPAVIESIARYAPLYEHVFSRYKRFQIEHNHVLGHYFRNLYQILKLIDSNAALSDSEKGKYTSILRAQLSTDELALLMLNCQENMVDSGQFRNLLVRYRMLEHLPLLSNYLGQYYYKSKDVMAKLADSKSIKQFLQLSNTGNSRKIKMKGAFGDNGIEI